MRHPLFQKTTTTAACVGGYLMLLGSNSVGAQTVADTPAPAEENDGTDPTSPLPFAKLSYEHLDLSLPASLPGDNSNSFAPTVGAGGDKPTGWCIQAGFQLINFRTTGSTVLAETCRQLQTLKMRLLD